MSRSKKAFLIIAAVFFLLLGYASYDIITRTTFPGSKSQLKERLKNKYLPSDTIRYDSASQQKQEKKL